MIKSTLRSQAGVTLIELLVGMGIMVILLVIMTNVFATSIEVQLRTEASVAIQQDSQYLISRLQYDVHRASAITQPATLGTTTNSLTASIDGEQWSYTVVNDNLVVTNSSGSAQLNSVSTKITQFDVTRIASSSGQPQVHIDFALLSRIQGSAASQSASYSFDVGSHQ